MKNSSIELLAPAGALPVALAAFDAGADAVYCGLKKFNARERSDNFSFEDMSKLIAYARRIGKKVYITFNTLVKESEIESAAEELANLYSLHPDALIVQDIGVVRMIREFFPGLAIHGSTQMALHDSLAIQTAERMGIQRVILERQVSIEELELMAKNTSLELEVFVHGALCACLSGTCLFSSWLGGFSGNRGKCKQPCRRLFRSDRGKEAFYLSSRDLAAIELIPKFRELGIASLKIEGRLRKADYVASVVSAYRKALDGESMESAVSILDNTCSRERSLGFYTENSMKTLIRQDVPGGVGQFCGRIKRVSRDSFEVELTNRIHVGDNIRIQSASGDEGQALTVLDLYLGARSVKKAFPGQLCRIGNRDKEVFANGIVYKIGETHDTMAKRCEKLPLLPPLLDFDLRLSSSGICAKLSSVSEEWNMPLNLLPAQNRAVGSDDLVSAFRISGDSAFAPGTIRAEVENNLFLPQSVLKTLRQQFWKWATETLRPERIRRLSYEKTEILMRYYRELTSCPATVGKNVYFLPPDVAVPETDALAARDLSSALRVGEECILPFFTPENRLAELRSEVEALISKGVRTFRITSLSHFALLKEYSGLVLKTAPPLPVANSFAVEELRSLGVSAVLAHIELSGSDLAELRSKSVLPLEVCTFGRPVILATRAQLSNVKTLSDSRGETFFVKKQEILTLLLPGVPMRLDSPAGTVCVHDLRYCTEEESVRTVSPFNSLRGLS